MRSTTGGAVSPHAPVLGLAHRWLGRFHVTGVFWYRLPYRALRHLPAWLILPTVVIFTGLFFVVLGRIRSAIAANLEPVLGSAPLWKRWTRSFRTMYAFAWCLADRYGRLADPGRFTSVLEGEENWAAVMKERRGVVLATAHVGPWETAVQLGVSELGRRIHVVREKEIDPRAQQFITEILGRTDDDYVTHFAGDNMALGVELVNALRAGDIVALQADRPRAAGRSTAVTFFGRAMRLPEGPAALARAAGVPVVPVFNFRRRGGVLCSVVRPAIRVAHTRDRQADIADAVRKLALEIEWAIRKQPYQWFCFKRLWH